jgi:hypothetical protein
MTRDPDTTDRSPARQADAERYRAIVDALARNQSEIRNRLT